MKSKKDLLENQLDAMLVDMASQKITTNKVSDFRASSLPNCPIRSLLFTQKTDSYSMGFYTSIGTAVHETAQKWLAVGDFKGKIFSCWKALETGEVIGPCFKDEIPKSWDNYTVLYEEITIQYKGLSGHVDLVVELLPGMYVVVDFKTTGLEGKKRRGYGWQKQYPASRSSIIQISTYAALLRKIFKLNIVAWCLVYVDREKVINSPRDYHKVLRPWNSKKHKHMLELIDAACEREKPFRKLLKILNETDEFSSKAVNLLKDMVINRPCVDEESYNEWIDYKFYQGPGGKGEEGVKDGKCVMRNSCLKGNRAAYEAIKRRL